MVLSALSGLFLLLNCLWNIQFHSSPDATDIVVAPEDSFPPESLVAAAVPSPRLKVTKVLLPDECV